MFASVDAEHCCPSLLSAAHFAVTGLYDVGVDVGFEFLLRYVTGVEAQKIAEIFAYVVDALI